MTITQNFEYFQYFNFETDYLENENFFQKTGILYRFLVESTKNEKVSFSCKTAMSEGNVKKNRMVTTK